MDSTRQQSLLKNFFLTLLTVFIVLFVSNANAGTKMPAISVTNCQELQDIKNNLGKKHKLVNDIDCSDTVNWNGGQGFEPIGSSGVPFSGVLFGRGKTISDLYINRPDSIAGLFGELSGNVRQVTLDNVYVRGNTYVGGLAAKNLGGIIVDVRVTGTIEGREPVIAGSPNSVAVGGLVGGQLGTGSFIIQSFADVTIRNPGGKSGGLVGENVATITHSFSKGQLLSGINWDDIIAHGQGAVNWDDISPVKIGGLVGESTGNALIARSYSAIDVAVKNVDAVITYLIGGITARNTVPSTITRTYASNTVNWDDIEGMSGMGVNWDDAKFIAGGLMANQIGGGTFITNSYWDTEKSGIFGTAGGLLTNGRTTQQMQMQATFDNGINWDDNNWDFDVVWSICEGVEPPDLKWHSPTCIPKIYSPDPNGGPLMDTNIWVQWFSIPEVVDHCVLIGTETQPDLYYSECVGPQSSRFISDVIPLNGEDVVVTLQSVLEDSTVLESSVTYQTIDVN